MDGVDRVKMVSGRRATRNPSPNRSMNRSHRRANWSMEDVFAIGSQARRSSVRAEEDEEALRWAAIEKLPTYDRLRTTIIKSFMDNNGAASNVTNIHKMVTHKEVDVRKLDINDRQEFIDRMFKVAEEDNEKFLQKFRNRIDK